MPEESGITPLDYGIIPTKVNKMWTWIKKWFSNYTDNNGYLRNKLTNTLVHRKIALQKYDQQSYPLPYHLYEVHHIDGNKKNNKIKNLQILTTIEHLYIHNLIEGKKIKQIQEQLR